MHSQVFYNLVHLLQLSDLINGSLTDRLHTVSTDIHQDVAIGVCVCVCVCLLHQAEPPGIVHDIVSLPAGRGRINRLKHHWGVRASSGSLNASFIPKNISDRPTGGVAGWNCAADLSPDDDGIMAANGPRGRLWITTGTRADRAGQYERWTMVGWYFQSTIASFFLDCCPNVQNESHII